MKTHFLQCPDHPRKQAASTSQVVETVLPEDLRHPDLNRQVPGQTPSLLSSPGEPPHLPKSLFRSRGSLLCLLTAHLPPPSSPARPALTRGSAGLPQVTGTGAFSGQSSGLRSQEGCLAQGSGPVNLMETGPSSPSNAGCVRRKGD